MGLRFIWLRRCEFVEVGLSRRNVYRQAFRQTESRHTIDDSENRLLHCIALAFTLRGTFEQP